MNNHTSVIIPYYNGDVDILLSNLKVLTQGENDKHLKEVLIIDDGSKIPLLTYKDTISDISDKIFILFQPNKGSCSARNLGISNSSSEIIVSTDQDCIVDSNRIENIIKPILYNGMVFVGGQTLSYNPNTFISNFVTARKFLRQPVVDENGKINTIITCNCAFLRDIAINIGMFTENSHIITDDLDFTYKFIKSGYQDLLSYNPLAIVYHKHRDSLKNLIKQRFGYGYGSMYHCLLSNRNPQEIGFQYPKIINLLKYTKESLQKSLLVHEKIDEEYGKFNKFCVFPILEFLIRLAKGYGRRKAYVEYNRTTKK